MVVCMIFDVMDVMDVSRTYSVSVFRTWYPTAILFSLVELWICGLYEDVEKFILPSRNVGFNLYLLLLMRCHAFCHCLYKLSNITGSQPTHV